MKPDNLPINCSGILPGGHNSQSPTRPGFPDTFLIPAKLILETVNGDRLVRVQKLPLASQPAITPKQAIFVLRFGKSIGELVKPVLAHFT